MIASYRRTAHIVVRGCCNDMDCGWIGKKFDLEMMYKRCRMEMPNEQVDA